MPQFSHVFELFPLQKLVLGLSVYRDDLCISLQETVSASQRTFTAQDLRSGTDYLVTIIAQYPNSVGGSTSAKQRTSEGKVEDSDVSRETSDKTLTQPFSHKTKSVILNLYQTYTWNVLFSLHTGSLPGVSSLRLIQSGFFSLSLGWDQPSSPIQGYRLTYGPRGQAHKYLCFCF